MEIIIANVMGDVGELPVSSPNTLPLSCVSEFSVGQSDYGFQSCFGSVIREALSFPPSKSAKPMQ